MVDGFLDASKVHDGSEGILLSKPMMEDSSLKKKGLFDGVENEKIAPGEVTEYDHDLNPEITKEVDRGFTIALKTKGIELDTTKEKKLVRKIDCYILSTMCILMSCQLMGKSSNSYASIIGLREDLNMTSKEYSWVGSAFYLGYLVFDYPAALILQKFPMAKVLGVSVIVWGVILCCHGACQSSATFLLCRTLLGAAQTFMDISFMNMTSQYYQKHQQYIRSATWLGLQGYVTVCIFRRSGGNLLTYI